ncbi:MAG TPA: hypothetical protein VH054_28815 [Polyangiaceae bacterium]|jgi:hypothetical protein|nr:hypothetical protein [Polyangiaceae bacterium]
MMREWLPIFAAALGVTLAQCKKDQGTTQAREAPAPTTATTIPSPHDTVCSVVVARPPFVVGVGGEAEGVCYTPVASPHPSANCGPTATETPCSEKKPWKPNLRAIVRSGAFEQSQLAPSIKEALGKIMPCISGPLTHRARLDVDASGKVKTTSSMECVAKAFDAMTLPGLDAIVIDLTST